MIDAGQPSVEVCIVTYGNDGTIEQAISSLPVLGPEVRVAIHDNWPERGSVAQAVTTAKSLGIRLRAELCEQNCGFARATNRLAFTSEADWLMFLNPDARISSWPGWGAMEGRDIIGPEIHGPNVSAAVVTYGRSRRVRDEIALRWLRHRPKVPRGVGYVSGAALLVRREVFARLGGFDEGFFMYYEDIDFCLRANSLGCSVWVEPLWAVEHMGGYSAALDLQVALVRSYESSAYFFEKHGGIRRFRLFAWMDAALRAVAASLVPKLRDQRELNSQLERHARHKMLSAFGCGKPRCDR